MPSTMTGLDSKEIRERFNLLKGRVCEAIAEELFTALHYEVHRFGVENAIPSFAAAIRRARQAGESEWNETLNALMRMPDLIIRKRKTYLIEVKFRANGKLHPDDDPAVAKHPYPHAYFLVIGMMKENDKEKAVITCARVADLKNAIQSGESATNALQPLDKCLELVEGEYEEDIVSQFRRLAKEFLGKLPDLPEITERLRRPRSHTEQLWRPPTSESARI